jgi:hypothetical protein
MWRTIHVVALGYPQNPRPEQKQAYRDFFASLRTVIPCAACAAGYADVLRRHPVDDALSGPGDLFTWSVVVHNEVARKLGQPEMSPEYVRTVYVFGDGRSEKTGAGRVTGGSGGERAFDCRFAMLASAAVLVVALAAFVALR